MQLSSPYTKKLSLELGGKNCAIVFADAFEEISSTHRNFGSSAEVLRGEPCRNVVDWTIKSSFSNQGEICLCTSRIFVHRSIYAAFVDAFVQAVDAIVVGDPSDSRVHMGALVSQGHMSKEVQSFIELAKQEAVVANAEKPLGNTNGFFVGPVVVDGAKNNSRLMQEEIFGPVVCLHPFETVDEVVELANSTAYGLCASVYTRDLRTANRVAGELSVGTVWINCWMVRDLSMPFGGTGASGIGREGGEWSLDFYSEAKTICCYNE